MGIYTINWTEPNWRSTTTLKSQINIFGSSSTRGLIKTKNPKSSKTNFKSHREVKISFMYDWLLTSIHPLKKHLKTCF